MDRFVGRAPPFEITVIGLYSCLAGKSSNDYMPRRRGSHLRGCSHQNFIAEDGQDIFRDRLHVEAPTALHAHRLLSPVAHHHLPFGLSADHPKIAPANLSDFEFLTTSNDGVCHLHLGTAEIY